MTSVKRVRARKLRKDEGATEEVIGKVAENVEKKTREVTKNKSVSKKVRSRKIRMSLSKDEEQKLDKAVEIEDNMSIIVMIFILVICFVIGISLGYVLYRIALNGGM